MTNLQKELDKIILEEGGKTLLLHSCCAPCSSYVLEYLAKHFDIYLFYYNPNIMPKEEHDTRLEELKRLVHSMPNLENIKIIESEYNPEPFLAISKGLENEPEGGARCEACFRLRLTESAKMAKEVGADYFTTTLSISPHKSSHLLDYVALDLSEQYGIKRLPANFKKREGYKRSVELSKEYNLYRQDWCGCPFSKLEHERNKHDD